MGTNQIDPLNQYDLDRYQSLYSAVQNLILEIKDSPEDKHLGFLGRGGSWQAFELEHNGRHLAVKISNGINHTPGATRRKATNLIPKPETPSVEQLVALDTSRGILITTRVPGKRLVDLTVSELATIPDEHYFDLIQNMKTAIMEGITFDPKPTNFLYDREKGFGFVDYSREQQKQVGTKEFTEAIENMAAGIVVALQNIGYYDLPKHQPDEMRTAIKAIKSGISASKRFLETASTDPDIFPLSALISLSKTVASQTEKMETTIDFYKTQLGLQPPKPDPPGAWWSR